MYLAFELRRNIGRVRDDHTTEERVWKILKFNGVSEARLSIRSRGALNGGIRMRASNCSDFPAENIDAPTDRCSSTKALGYVTYTSIMTYKER